MLDILKNNKVLILIVILVIIAIGYVFISRNSLVSEYENKITILEKSIEGERIRHEKVIQDVARAYQEAALAREREFKKMNEELADAKKKHDDAVKLIDEWKKGKEKKIISDAGGDPKKLADIVSSTFGYSIEVPK